MNLDQRRPLAGLFFLACAVVFLSTPQTEASSLLLADFKFDGNGQDYLSNSPPMDVSGFSFTNGSIHFADAGFQIGYLPGSAKINGLDYNSFTVALDFNPSDFVYPHWNLLSGGPGYRWIGLETDPLGHLHLRFNNGSYLFAPTNIVRSNFWHTLVCSVDLVSQPSIGKIALFLDGQQVLGLTLDNFQFNVPAGERDSETVFSFQNSGNGTILSGYADNLRVYRRALSSSEIVSLFSPRLSIRRMDRRILVGWQADFHGYVLESNSSLRPPICWTSDPRLPVMDGDQYVIIDDAIGTTFYRLRRP
jgi:hypothetical protein